VVLVAVVMVQQVLVEMVAADLEVIVILLPVDLRCNPPVEAVVEEEALGLVMVVVMLVMVDLVL
jgi:hypothetical protein